MKQNPCKSKESQTKSTLKSKETRTNPKKKKKKKTHRTPEPL